MTLQNNVQYSRRWS